jgi:predicted nucleic acid-binding protein
MYLVDTNVISESRKGQRADPGVADFFRRVRNEVFLPVQVVGELQSGIERVRQRGDSPQARLLQEWFQSVLEDFSLHFLAFDLECAKIWGMLIGADEQHQIDKQIAAIALLHNLIVVTRNTAHFAGTGVIVLNPFLADRSSGAREY